MLAPGGTLEVRVIDPAPNSKEPAEKLQSWLDQHLIFNLEKSFRSLRPSRLIPVWLRDTGFEIMTEPEDAAPQQLRFPCIIEDDTCSVENRIACEVGRRLWDEVWGEFVELNENGSRYWWEDDEIVKDVKDSATEVIVHVILARKL